jgi:hypothetical protein
MRFDQHLAAAVRELEGGYFESALMNVCVAVDAAARETFPGVSGVGKRYKQFLRERYWLIEPMAHMGLNLEQSRFENLALPGKRAPDLAEFIYENFRCRHTHGEEVSESISVLPTSTPGVSNWSAAPGSLKIPDRIIWALIACVVLAKVNKGSWPSLDHVYFALGEQVFPFKDWWGREDDFRAIAGQCQHIRNTLDWSEYLAARQPPAP